MKRLTRYICDRAHGAEGTSSEHFTGAYRRQFEAMELVEHLAAIEDILGDNYDLERLRELWRLIGTDGAWCFRASRLT